MLSIEKLDNFLNAWYRYQVLKTKGSKDNRTDFRNELDVDPQLKQAAETRLNELKQIEDRRCFISKVHKEFLQEVLST